MEIWIQRKSIEHSNKCLRRANDHEYNWVFGGDEHLLKFMPHQLGAVDILVYLLLRNIKEELSNVILRHYLSNVEFFQNRVLVE